MDLRTEKELQTLKRDIEKKLGADSNRFAVFDFDNTCITGDISEAVFAYMCKNNLLKDKTVLDNVNGDYHKNIFAYHHELLKQGKMAEAYSFLPQTLSGFTPEEIRSLTLETIKHEGTSIGTKDLFGHEIACGLEIKSQIPKLIDFLRKENVEIWVVSASPEIEVKTALEYYGIDAKTIGIRNKIQNGIFTKEIETPMSIKEGKVECIKKYIKNPTKPLIAFGDSINDLPMLEYSEIKVVVDRGKKFTEEALFKNWFVI